MQIIALSVQDTKCPKQKETLHEKLLQDQLRKVW